MKTTKMTLALLIAFNLTSPALVGLGAELPFHGCLLGNETATLSGSYISSVGSGAGTATHLGQFQVTWQAASTNLLGQALYEFTSTNGDKLTAETHGTADISQYPLISVAETATITGGTGRFLGATGTLAFTTFIIVLSGTSVTQDSFSSWFDGSIVYQPSSQTVTGAADPAGFRLRFAGIPAHQNTIYRALSPSGGWGALSTMRAPADGRLGFLDTQLPQGQAFYRTAQQ